MPRSCGWKRRADSMPSSQTLFDRGREQAAALDASGRCEAGRAGPLAGVPFLLKILVPRWRARPRRWAAGHCAPTSPARPRGSSSATWMPVWWCSARPTPRVGKPLHHRTFAVRSDRQSVVAGDTQGRLVGRICVGRGAGVVRPASGGDGTGSNPGARIVLRPGWGSSHDARAHLVRPGGHRWKGWPSNTR